MYYKKICRKGGENFIKYETILEVEKLQARRREKLYLSTKKENKVPVGSFTFKSEMLIFSESFGKLSLPWAC
jgi:hypothetical protein